MEDRHVTPVKYIILIPSQPVFVKKIIKDLKKRKNAGALK
jgi:hypothetical protein